MKHPVKVPSGTVEATHRHPQFGYCIIVKQMGAATSIRVQDGGTALIAARSLERIFES